VNHLHWDASLVSLRLRPSCLAFAFTPASTLHIHESGVYSGALRRSTAEQPMPKSNLFIIIYARGSRLGNPILNELF
jgi:hypothetical protein